MRLSVDHSQTEAVTQIECWIQIDIHQGQDTEHLCIERRAKPFPLMP
jgi:hypothetical protein